MQHLEIVQKLEQINISIGVAMNALLLLLIVKYTRASLGTYKYLMILFASYDIFLCIVHWIIDHQVIILGTKFIAVARSFAESRILTSFYCGSFTVPFTLTIINFIYRLCAVKRPQWIPLFARRPYIIMLVLICFIGAFAWFCVCYFVCTGDEEDEAKAEARVAYHSRYGHKINDGFVIMDHWRNGTFTLRPALAVAYFDAVIVVAILTVIGIAALTLNTIHTTTRLSGYSRNLQTKLFWTLCAQASYPSLCLHVYILWRKPNESATALLVLRVRSYTAVPVLFVYIPFFVGLSMPFVGFSDFGVASSLAVLNLCFPAIDAIVIMSLISDYRLAIVKIIAVVLRHDAVKEIDSSHLASKSISISTAARTVMLELK